MRNKLATTLLWIACAMSAACSSHPGKEKHSREVTITNGTSHVAYFKFRGKDECRVQDPAVEMQPGEQQNFFIELECPTDGNYYGDENGIDALIAFSSEFRTITKIIGDKGDCTDKGCNGKEIWTPSTSEMEIHFSNSGSASLFAKEMVLNHRDCRFEQYKPIEIPAGSDKSQPVKATCLVSSYIAPKNRALDIAFYMSPVREVVEYDWHMSERVKVKPSSESISCDDQGCNEVTIL